MAELKQVEVLQGYSPNDMEIAGKLKEKTSLKDLGTALFIQKVAERIKVKWGTTLKPYHVMSVIRDAVAYGLDPASKEVYAFLQNKDGQDILTFGVSIEGWAKILDARGCSFSFKVLSRGQRDGRVFPTEMECTIDKPNGTKASWVTSYSECVNENSPVWKQQPTQMMQIRSLARCARIACGLGSVYSMDEARAFWEECSGKAGVNAAPAPAAIAVAQQQAPALPAQPTTESLQPDLTKEREEAIKLFRRCKDKEELRKMFGGLTPELKADPALRQESIQIANALNEKNEEKKDV